MKLILIGLLIQLMTYTQAYARGEFPPPPPFQGGNIGDWLGSGPIFGFEPPSVKNPWVGGGGGGIGSGGANGGWGGAWWTGNGPLGGGGWGGWGGWGSGYGSEPVVVIDTGTGKKGHTWPDEPPHGRPNCITMTETGGYHGCGCKFIRTRNMVSGQEISGQCMRSRIRNIDRERACSFIGAPCIGDVP